MAPRDAIRALQTAMNAEVLGQPRGRRAHADRPPRRRPPADRGPARPGQDPRRQGDGEASRGRLQPHPVHPRPAALGRDRHRIYYPRAARGSSGSSPARSSATSSSPTRSTAPRPRSRPRCSRRWRSARSPSARQTHALPDLFIVMATQNPIEQEGTYPLPEAQTDRFLMKVLVDYPAPAGRARRPPPRPLRGAGRPRRRPGARRPRRSPPTAALALDDVFAARREIGAIHIAEAIESYIVDLVNATRHPDKYSKDSPARSSSAPARAPAWRSTAAPAPMPGSRARTSSPRPTSRPSRPTSSATASRSPTRRAARAASADDVAGRPREARRRRPERRMPDARPAHPRLARPSRRARGAAPAASTSCRASRSAARSPAAAPARLRGRGLEFEELRAYLPGDDVRAIDWKVTARTGAPHVRVTREERDRPALLLVDQRQSMFFGIAAQHEVGHRRRDRRARRLAHPRPGRPRRRPRPLRRRLDAVPARRSREAVLRLLALVADRNGALAADAPAVPGAAARLNLALEQAARIVSHDWLLLVVSDFDGADDATLRILTGIARGNDLVLALVHDPSAHETPRAGPPRGRRRPAPGRDRLRRRPCPREPRRRRRRPAEAPARLAGAARRRHPALERRRGDRAAAPPPLRRAATPERLMEGNLVDLLGQLDDIAEPPPVSLFPATWAWAVARRPPPRRPRRRRSGPSSATAAPPPTAAPPSPSSAPSPRRVEAGGPTPSPGCRRFSAAPRSPPSRAPRSPPLPATPGPPSSSAPAAASARSRRPSPTRPTGRSPSTAPPPSPPRARWIRRHHA